MIEVHVYPFTLLKDTKSIPLLLGKFCSSKVFYLSSLAHEHLTKLYQTGKLDAKVSSVACIVVLSRQILNLKKGELK